MKRFATTLALTALLASCGAAPAVEGTAEQLAAKGKYALAHEAYDRAIFYFEQAVERENDELYTTWLEQAKQFHAWHEQLDQGEALTDFASHAMPAIFKDDPIPAYEPMLKRGNTYIWERTMRQLGNERGEEALQATAPTEEQVEKKEKPVEKDEAFVALLARWQQWIDASDWQAVIADTDALDALDIETSDRLTALALLNEAKRKQEADEAKQFSEEIAAHQQEMSDPNRGNRQEEASPANETGIGRMDASDLTVEEREAMSDEALKNYFVSRYRLADKVPGGLVTNEPVQRNALGHRVVIIRAAHPEGTHIYPLRHGGYDPETDQFYEAFLAHSDDFDWEEHVYDE